MFLRENKICTWFDLIGAFFEKREGPDSFVSDMQFTGSGKASIALVLSYLCQKGILTDKNSEILVPQWLGYWVYDVMHGFGFPCLDYNERIKLFFVYHQYGFPQNMDEIMSFAKEKDIYVIEDCAHVYESYYKGKRLGTIGDAAIFSFSKMLPTFLGGAVLTQDRGLQDFIKKKEMENDLFASLFSLVSKVVSEKVSAGFNKWVEMSYALYVRNTKINKVSFNLLKKELSINSMAERKRNYLFLLDYFKDYDIFSGLEKDTVPYVVPLITDKNCLDKLNKSMNKENIKTGIYHFDVNRNLLNPKFLKCVWVPVHQGINEEEMGRICFVIKKGLDEVSH
jgi:dTDP-4-amino-4,6-dideoxygalactose transaminase